MNIPDIPTLELTVKGKALHAKIQAGGGSVGLNITRVVTGAGFSQNPHELDNVIDMRQTATITGKHVFGLRADISIILTNAGNPNIGEAPLSEGYQLTQFGMFAIDPDEGEILYRISQFANPNFVPAASQMGFTLSHTWNITTGNASEVHVTVDPKGIATLSTIWQATELSGRALPLPNTQVHLL